GRALTRLRAQHLANSKGAVIFEVLLGMKPCASGPGARLAGRGRGRSTGRFLARAEPRLTDPGPQRIVRVELRARLDERRRSDDGVPKPVRTGEVLGSGKVVLFGVPGAFTPGCSKIHLPGFVQHGGELKAKGVDKIACVAVNDAWVMDAWGKEQGANDILMLA